MILEVRSEHISVCGYQEGMVITEVTNLKASYKTGDA